MSIPLIWVTQVKKVHWFWTQADMMWWVEEVKILEEDFQHLVRAAECMETFWGSVTKSPKTCRYWVPKNVAMESIDMTGYIVYMQQKADMYCQMASNTWESFASAGGDWPRDDKTVAEYALRCWPDLSVDWTETERYLNEQTHWFDQSLILLHYVYSLIILE
jgi:hypothetical protein